MDIKKYIDYETALKRLGGKMPLYIRLLKQFFTLNYCKSLEELCIAGDKEGFAILAHSVKGASSNLSLMEIYSYCMKLESNIKNGIDCTDDMAEFKSVYQQTEKIVDDFIAERNG